MNSGGHIPLLAKEGRPLASDGSECVLKHLRVSDHPVCGASVASRLFIDAAATPPHEEGNAPRLNNSRNSFKGSWTIATNNLLVSIFLLHATSERMSECFGAAIQLLA